MVIRPDSGDPADIICGTVREFGKGNTPAEKGSIELLWDEFGGTVNDKGFKVLDSHVGLIYGDAMNFARIDDICERLAEKGFSIEPVVFGLGSFGYQYQTRDTFGFAMKATNVVIEGDEKPIFKDPKTDNGLKKSLKGRIGVYDRCNPDTGKSELVAIDGQSKDRYVKGTNLLKTVWKDGEFVRKVGFDEIRNNAGLVL